MKALSYLVIAAGITFGVYFGVWHLYCQGLVDGILMIVGAFQGKAIIEADFAWALFRTIFGIPVAYCIGLIAHEAGGFIRGLKK